MNPHMSSAMKCPNLQSNKDCTGTDGKADNGHEGTHDQVRVQNLLLQQRERSGLRIRKQIFTNIGLFFPQ